MDKHDLSPGICETTSAISSSTFHNFLIVPTQNDFISKELAASKLIPFPSRLCMNKSKDTLALTNRGKKRGRSPLLLEPRIFDRDERWLLSYKGWTKNEKGSMRICVMNLGNGCMSFLE